VGCDACACLPARPPRPPACPLVGRCHTKLCMDHVPFLPAELLDYGADCKEQAKSSLREIRTLKVAGVALQGGHGLPPVLPHSPPASPGGDMGMGMSPF